MGDAAKKLEQPKAPWAPDWSKPVALKYWFLPYEMGVHIQRSLAVGGDVNDGCGTTGKCKSITFFPASGHAVAEVFEGWRPGRADAEQELRIKQLVFIDGHGAALDPDEKPEHWANVSRDAVVPAQVKR
jgi:hypothetical protein